MDNREIVWTESQFAGEKLRLVAIVIYLKNKKCKILEWPLNIILLSSNLTQQLDYTGGQK